MIVAKMTRNHVRCVIFAANGLAGRKTDMFVAHAAEPTARTGAMLPRRIRLIGRSQRLDVGYEAPDLVARDSCSPRRHSELASFGDRRKDRLRIAAVAPQAVTKAGAHAAAGVIAVAATAVVPVEKTPAVSQNGLVVGVWILGDCDRPVRSR